MDSVNSLISNMSEEIYLELKTAVELGRWESGNTLSESQRVLSIQALISFENKHLDEKDRTAYIHRPEHDACDNSVGSAIEALEQPVKFLS